MKLKCPGCHQHFETTQEPERYAPIQCPNCAHVFTMPTEPPPAIQRHQPELNLGALHDPAEGLAFGWLVFFSIPVWIFLATWSIVSLGLIPLVMGIMALVKQFAQRFAMAYIKTNAVQVSENQFPEIHRIAKTFAARLEKPLPTIYVMQQNVWNAFATKIAGKRLVVLLSGAVDSLLLKGSLTQLAFVVGHELGHHYAGHLNYWRHTTAQMGSWFIWVGLWYHRRCEFTCDRYGLACARSLEESQRAVCNMAVGAQLAGEVDIEQAIDQWKKHQSEFFVKYRTIYSTHPHHLWRLDALKSAAQQLRIA